MVALAAGTSAVAPAVIAAAASITSALLLALVALRAQSAKEQLEQIRRIIEAELDDEGRAALVNDRLKRALREVLGEDPHSRRWYDRDP